MSVITKGKTFANGEQLTAGKLNQMLDAAVFNSSAVDNTKTTLSGGAITIAPNGITATEIAQSFLDTIYPVGSVYTNATVSTNPGTLLGFGTWVAVGEGRVLVGKASSGTFDTAGATGGAETITLTSAQSGVPAHYHRVFSRGGEPVETLTAQNNQDRRVHEGGGHTNTTTNALTLDGETDFNTAADAASAHSNLQPYEVVYMWKRTA